jgi:hypothetical protein
MTTITITGAARLLDVHKSHVVGFVGCTEDQPKRMN